MSVQEKEGRRRGSLYTLKEQPWDEAVRAGAESAPGQVRPGANGGIHLLPKSGCSCIEWIAMCQFTMFNQSLWCSVEVCEALKSDNPEASS